MVGGYVWQTITLLRFWEESWNAGRSLPIHGQT